MSTAWAELVEKQWNLYFSTNHRFLISRREIYCLFKHRQESHYHQQCFFLKQRTHQEMVSRRNLKVLQRTRTLRNRLLHDFKTLHQQNPQNVQEQIQKRGESQYQWNRKTSPPQQKSPHEESCLKVECPPCQVKLETRQNTRRTHPNHLKCTQNSLR